MLDFVQRHGSKVIGVLSGFDRMLFRGTHMMLSHVCALMNYLWAIQVPLTQFRDWSEGLTQQIRLSSQGVMEEAGRPYRYLNNPAIRKEELAREIAAREGISSGPICLLGAVEPCWSYELTTNKEKKKLVLEPRYRKCLHLYHYMQHERLGLMHVRLQTWLPFAVRVCLNGREWLCRELDQAGIGYQRRDNCLVKVSNLAKAQEVLDGQLNSDWPKHRRSPSPGAGEPKRQRAISVASGGDRLPADVGSGADAAGPRHNDQPTPLPRPAPAGQRRWPIAGGGGAR